jgi:hypothetical protein
MTMWKEPPIIKIYEALGAVGDERVEIAGNQAVVWSSMRKKYYDVSYDSDENALMANDNGSYWQGYLGYPGIAYLMLRGEISYDRKLATYLSGFDWKAIATAHKNDWDAVCEQVRDEMKSRYPELDLAWFDLQLSGIMLAIRELGIHVLGKKTRPPQ